MKQRQPYSGHKLTVEPYTQWEAGVASPASACGPSTMAALTEYWSTGQGKAFIPGTSHFKSKANHINYIYSHHGGTSWGMSVRSFIKGIKAYIGASSLRLDEPHKLLVTAFNDIDRYKAEIHAERPVAIKFDKWFSFRWRSKFAYDYHWVLGVGYEESVGTGGPVLIIHDNGVLHKDGSFTPGRERRIHYSTNKDIITMVAVNLTKV